jgi:pyruvate formate lyase activating enzyme
MKIGGLQENSLIDWEGKICSIIFTSGCNFRCPFCHNPDLVVPSPEGEGGEDRLDDILEKLGRFSGWLDGVVVTGGEPTLQVDLEEAIRQIRESGFLVKLDSNGSRPDVLRKLISGGLVDYLAMDIKTALDDDRYRRVCGVPVDTGLVRESISLIRESGIDYEFRTTVVPGLVGPEEVGAIGREIEGASRYVLQRFLGGTCLDPSYNDLEPYPTGVWREIEERAKEYLPDCKIRGDVK